MADIEKLKALAEKAGPGSWYEAGELRYHCSRSGDTHGLHHDEDRFIAAASPAAVLELIAEVERLRHVSAWVSVEERLPESGAPVLVWCDGCGCAGVAWIRQGAWLMPEPQPLGYESITHWMPLPAGPTATESRP